MVDLTPEEQNKLNDFQVITAFPDEQYDKVVAMLGNNSWNLEVSLSKYFDGLLEEEAAREPEPQRPREPTPPPAREVPAQHQRLADFMELNTFQGTHLLMPQLPIVRPISNKWRAQPGLNRQADHFGIQSFAQSPLLFVLLFIPRTLTFLLTGLGWLFSLFFPPSPDIVPSAPTRESFNAIEHYETITHDKSQIEFYKGAFNDAFTECKRDSKFMLLMLVGDNDSSTTFIKQVLNNESLSKLVKDEEVLVYMAHVCEPQGLEIARTMRTRTIPSAYLLANVSSGPSGISSMSICARLSTKSLNPFLSRMTAEVERYKPELITRRIEMEELDYSRKIREMQDQAYAESLVADRVKMEKREQEEKAEQDKIAKENWQKEQRKKFYCSLLDKFEKYEDLPKGEFTTIRFKLPSGEGITQRFHKEHSLFDVYSFIDLELHLKDLTDEQRKEMEESHELCDDDYHHDFTFELTSPYPRYTVPVDQEKTVLETDQLWPNGSVMLEFLHESDEESDDE